MGNFPFFSSITICIENSYNYQSPPDRHTHVIKFNYANQNSLPPYLVGPISCQVLFILFNLELEKCLY